MEVRACKEEICWLVYPLCRNLAICLFSASIAVDSRSNYISTERKRSTSKKRGMTETRVVEIAIHAIMPVIFPAYKSPLSENTYVVSETNEIVEGRLALLHKSRVHRLIHRDHQLFLDISRIIKITTQADFFPFGVMFSINERMKTREMMQKRGEQMEWNSIFLEGREHGNYCLFVMS